MTERLAQLKQLLEKHILCLDGATGTWFQDRELSVEDFGGSEFEGCNEHLVLTRPGLILDLHRAYLEDRKSVV